jgi:hypothetical protein
MFYNLPDLAAVSSDHWDELDHYLSMDAEDIKDGILWWHDKHATFPHLSHMALDYLSIPGKWSSILCLLDSLCISFKQL